MMRTALRDRIDALLPQTQCTRCGYPTCRAYAAAIASDEADIDRCPPGGHDGVVALAQLLGREVKPVNPAYGSEAAPVVAFIDEDVCIGCTKCIQACPVDAIVGAAKRMHTILADECTGCGLCLPPCPVDCIALLPIAEQPLARSRVLDRAAHARMRFEARETRLSRDGRKASRRIMAPAPSTSSAPRQRSAGPTAAETQPAAAAMPDTQPLSRAAVLEAIARGKARRAARKEPGSQ